MRARAAFLGLLLFGACSHKPGLEHTIPHDVQAGYTAACDADTATLKSLEQTSFAATNSYRAQTSPLHKVTVTLAGYTITVADARCGTVGHTVGATPKDH